MSTQDDANKAVEEAQRRFSTYTFVIKDHYKSPNYPYTAPAWYISAGGAPSYGIQSGGWVVEDCAEMSSSPLIRKCKWVWEPEWMIKHKQDCQGKS